MWDSCVSLKHGVVLLFSEQQECETSTAGLVLSSPSLCTVTSSLSLFHLLFWLLFFPKVLGCPSSGMEGATHYLCQREHPMYRWVLPTTRNRNVIILLQILNKCEQHLVSFWFFAPSFFSVDHVYFWKARCVWRDCWNFSNWLFSEKNSFLKEAISDWDFSLDMVWFFQQHWILQTDCHRSGVMMCLVRAGSSCGVSWWTHSCFTATWLPGCTRVLVCEGKEMGLYFPKAPAALIISVPMCCQWLPKKMPSRKLEIQYILKLLVEKLFQEV